MFFVPRLVTICYHFEGEEVLCVSGFNSVRHVGSEYSLLMGGSLALLIK